MSLVLNALDRWAAEHPDQPALRGAGLNLTWRQLHAAVDQAVARLKAKLPAHGPVALALDNGPAWVVADLALMRLGRTSVPLPPFFTGAQVEGVIADAGVSAIVLAGPNLDIAVTATGAAPVALHEGTAKITYTSGSTGQPKGVCLSQAQMEAVAVSLVEVLGAGYAGVHLSILPLGVLLENVAGLYSVILAGGTYHAARLAEVGFAQPFQPDFARMAQAVAATRASSLILTPELLRGLIAAKTALRLDLPALRLVAVGGAKVAPSLLAAARAAGIPVLEGYGLSECASVVALNRPGLDHPGAVGQVLPHLTVEIAADGEIVVGPRPFLGYVGGPAQVGPVRTGDLGALSADGFLRILGRKSNTLINAFGRNIAPEWVESELLAQPEIAQALVFGEAQPTLGALIVPSSAAVTPEQLQAAVARANAGLPDYAHVAHWRPVRPFDPARGELTGNGRPRRAVLLAAHADVTQPAEVI